MKGIKKSGNVWPEVHLGAFKCPPGEALKVKHASIQWRQAWWFLTSLTNLPSGKAEDGIWTHTAAASLVWIKDVKLVCRSICSAGFHTMTVMYFSQYVFNLVERRDSCMPAQNTDPSDDIIYGIGGSS